MIFSIFLLKYIFFIFKFNQKYKYIYIIKTNMKINFSKKLKNV